MISTTELLVYAQNEIKDRQVHPTQKANEYVKQYASLGLGFANHSYFLAKNDVKYGSNEALLLHDRWMEHFQYGLIKASMEYAKERGSSAPMFYKNAYAKGLMPQDRYKKTVDELVQRELDCDWDTLRKDIKEYGLWNCALSMIPPSETSSVIGGMTSSIEPIKDIITIKDTKEGNLIQVAPEALKLSDKYDYTFNRKDMTSSYIKHLAVTQKWIDMGISGNTFYNPELYEDKKIPEKQVMSDIFMLKKYGVKTLYYSNIYVEDEVENEDENCAGGGCSV
jgi:ribonucleoside-diphosphate reductase alpha chain